MVIPHFGYCPYFYDIFSFSLSLVAIINRHRIKIIIKEIQGGKKFFWSLIPFWKTRKDAMNGDKKILHEGDLEVE